MKVQINFNQNNDEIDEQKIKNNFKEVKQNIFEEKEKQIESSILEQGFLIDRMDNLKNKREIDIQIIIKNLFKDNNSLEKEKLKKDEEFFISKGYILTEKSCERMVKLIHFIRRSHRNI